MHDYVIAKYLRLSIDDAVTGSMSIPHQRRLLDRHIETLDIPNARVLEFVDDGFSGVSIERPAMREMLDLIQCGEVNCVITKDFSRFSRSAIESGYYIEQVFPLYRIRFISVNDGFDSHERKNDTGGMEVAFKFLLHDYYSRDLSAKIKSAKRTKMRSGEYIVANTIYGYRKGDSGKLEIDPEPAAVVRLIFKMALGGLPTSIIRDRLCEARYPTPREYIETRRGKRIEKSCVWTARMVLTILGNEQYTGTYVSGKQELKAIGSHSKIRTDKSEWIIIPDRHPAIISKDDFAAVQALLSRFKGSTTMKPLANLLQDEERYKRARLVSGERIAATPLYGYSKARDGKWEIDVTAAGVIRTIFDLALKGCSFTDISRTLAESRYPAPREYMQLANGRDIAPACNWSNKRVREILQNVQYTGAYVAGKVLKDYDTGKSFHTAPSDWIVIPNKHPAIIGQDVFGRIQEIMAAGKVRRKNMRPRDYLLRGNILKCGCCGYALAYDDSTSVSVYRCQHTLGDPAAECHRMCVNARKLEEAVLGIFRKQAEVVFNSRDLSELRNKNTAERRLAEFEKQIRHYERQRQACYERFVRLELDHDAFQALKSDYTSRIDGLKEQSALVRQTERSRELNRKAFVLAKETLSETAAERALVEALVDKIYVSPGECIEIRWKFESFAANS